MMQAPEYYFEQEGCWISEWWNISTDEDVSIARARLDPGATTRGHRLRGSRERYLILEGRGRAEIGDAPPRDVEAGARILIPSDTAQRITNTGTGDLIFLAICTPRFRPERYEILEAD